MSPPGADARGDTGFGPWPAPSTLDMPHDHPGYGGSRRIKPDRLLVGVLAGAVLFYLFGRAVGLDRR
jgi:hypothetical protein